eukprot:Lithocolla_globosa_v1_NODE_7955_length_882_cov_8.951632.p2 type:complete len:117 gc:universal NODE_7955_length_882_cov_8.951632:642-292(-)
MHDFLFHILYAIAFRLDLESISFSVLCLEVCGRAHAIELALDQNGDTGAQGLGLVHGVRGQHTGPTWLRVLHVVPQHAARVRVEPSGGLVKYQKARPSQRGEPKRQLTLGASAQIL